MAPVTFGPLVVFDVLVPVDDVPVAGVPVFAAPVVLPLAFVPLLLVPVPVLPAPLFEPFLLDAVEVVPLFLLLEEFEPLVLPLAFEPEEPLWEPPAPALPEPPFPEFEPLLPESEPPLLPPSPASTTLPGFTGAALAFLAVFLAALAESTLIRPSAAAIRPAMPIIPRLISERRLIEFTNLELSGPFIMALPVPSTDAYTEDCC